MQSQKRLGFVCVRNKNVWTPLDIVSNVERAHQFRPNGEEKFMYFPLMPFSTNKPKDDGIIA